MGYIAISQILLAIQTFGQKKVCRGRKSSSMPGNMFATQGFQLKRVCRGMGYVAISQSMLAIQGF